MNFLSAPIKGEEYACYYKAPYGLLKLTFDDEALVRISHAESMGKSSKTKLSKETVKQLDKYFAGKREEFDLPLKPMGTDFQLRCWKALCDVPYGTTQSYKDIAERVDSPKGFRAVGLANNRNPLMIIVPCHRIIGANGKLVGYAGGVHIKEHLLRLEGVLI